MTKSQTSFEFACGGVPINLYAASLNYIQLSAKCPWQSSLQEYVM